MHIQETVLNSISAIVFFGIAVSLANFINTYASYLRALSADVGLLVNPITTPAQATTVSLYG